MANLEEIIDVFLGKLIGQRGLREEWQGLKFKGIVKPLGRTFERLEGECQKNPENGAPQAKPVVPKGRP